MGKNIKIHIKFIFFQRNKENGRKILKQYFFREKGKKILEFTYTKIIELFTYM